GGGGAEKGGGRGGARAVVLDAERGAARVAAPGLQLDINDFRAADLAGDLVARDFTVNALAVPLVPLLLTGRARVVDPTGGRADLRAGRLRPARARGLAADPPRAPPAVRPGAPPGPPPT